ncbi:MAG: IclR family transcriptional regulator [Hyphomicrobiales bacterium]
MGTTTKTLKLLDLISAERPELGLTQFVRLSGYDKATTHRRLTELVTAGFLEKDADSKRYRLGSAILRLANVREQTFPKREAARRILQNLSSAVCETVHLSVFQNDNGLTTLVHIDDVTHSNRISIEPGEVLPFHATASGLVFLAFSAPEVADGILARALPKLCDDTVVDPEQIREQTATFRKKGFGAANGTYEAGVYGLSAPVFEAGERCVGGVAVATPTSRITPELKAAIQVHLKKTAIEISHAWGGDIPQDLLEIWNV